MACVLRYVDKNGHVVECFMGIVHVTDTSAISLKMTIDDLFCRQGLNISRLHGQGYDGLTLVGVARKHKDIVSLFTFVANVVNVVGGSCKRRGNLREKQISIVTEDQLQRMRKNGWESLLDEVSSFCVKHEILVPNMDDPFLAQGRPRRDAHKNSNLHNYRVELFYAIIDMQLQELSSCFDEVNAELLLCVASLCPADSFFASEKQKLIRLAQIYPNETLVINLRIIL
ncbi:uncharacterized protein LOC132270487 [Cornus florida]|uniref:uncharacterized protein LOC132270487 n=1 Tax=Cornus florida TaxID=4283 RepID=UPI00289C732E|nr:uncharacterized protein LOC132270487 [Cornus florida]